ncbi:MAG: Hia/Hsf adhesin N-terminal domain-containing protein, partial [Haemophilus parainfluenzae]|nr:Hia/Hsf adhesin N-terminal domain-containing protein [Haemophilus parainfluenzae]
MNKIYKVLWNHAAQNWVVTSELARGNVKSSTNQLTNQLTDQPTSQLKKSFTIATLSAVIIASLFSTSAMAYTPNANGREQAVTGSLAIGEQDDGSGGGSGATVSASNGGSSTAGWTTTTNSHHSIAIGGSSLVNNTANALAIGFKANLNNSTKGNVALGAYSTAGAAHAGGDAETIQIGGKTYNFAGAATNQTSVLSIGSGKNVTDWAEGQRQNNRGHFSDRQGANTPRYNVRQIQNVAAGRVSEDSTDAINGSQLHAVVNAINASSKYVWKVTSDGGKNQSLQAVTNNETVTFAAGNNMEVMQDPNDLKKFIYSTKNDVTFNKVTVGGNEFNTNGLTIGNGGPSMTKTGIDAGNKKITNVANGTNNNDAVNVSQLNAAKSNVAKGTNIASVTTSSTPQGTTYTVNAIGTNVTSNNNLITATKTATANNTNNQTNTYTIGLKTKNVTANKDSGKYDEIPATEGDGVVTAKALLEALKKAGWKLQANGVGNTIIKAGDVVNFVNGTGTTASVTSSNQGNKITFNINTSNLTVSKAGTTTGTISADNAGNHFATATSVANAINGAFWKAKGAGNGSGHTEQPIHAGDLVTFKGGNGIKVDQDAGTFTFSLDEEYIKTHPGLKGPKGDKGDKGDKGATGAQGAQGPRGLQGERGPQGEKGETGAPGRDGITPTVKTQDNNDGTHIVTITTGDKSSTFTVKDGAKGEKGDKGDQGVAGAKGDKGDKGDQGVAGAKGDKGDKGDQGVAGAKGDKGDKGDQGVAGAKGDKGDK